MSHEDDKYRHSTRMHREEAAIRKQQKIALQHGLDRRQVELESHRFAKHHAMDCGNPECHMCGNVRKVTGDRTVQEKSFMQTEGWDD